MDSCFTEMSVSTFQKITFISCLVLCVSLFLPKIFLSKGKKDVVQSEVGPGHVPPLRYSQPFSEDHDQWQLEPLYTKPFNPEAISRSKGAGKPNLLGQVIPVYGFGIFLYIIYIFFKLTSKDRSPRPECRFPILIPENTMQELPDYEMVQLQARLRQMEGVRERRASKAIHPPARSRRGSRRREERKLRQLKQITRVMLEGRPLEGVSPEVEAEETPYSSDWEGYSEETFPKYEVAFRGRRYPSVILEEPDMDVPTAEELAERMGREEEEDGDDDSDDDNDDDDDNDVCNDDDDDDDEEEKVKNETDEDKVDGAENNPTECKEDEESNPAEDEEEEDEESEEEEEEETEPHEAELIKEDDDEDDTHQQDEEHEEEEEEVGEDYPCLPHDTDDEDQGHQPKVARKCREPHSSKRQISFSDRRHVFHYPKGDTVGCKYEDDEDDDEEDEEDDEHDNEEDDDMEEEDKEDDQKEVVEKEEEDPLMEAESLGFHAEDECDPEEQEVNLLDFLLTYQPEVTISSNQPVPLKTPVSGTLRMRHKKPKKKN